jgi:bifunctional UDP-N-acetylglucosamine pyrophosphorylase / glucosamine-1-phosphate N-acetyltransferase
MFEKTTAVILAAGQGTRMKSALPKVLHPVAGRPLIHYPVRAALEAGCGEVVVVVGHGREAVASYLSSAFHANDGVFVRTAVQEQQRGTGDAAKAGLSAVRAEAERVLILNGDIPLITSDDVAPVAKKLDDDPAAAISIATCTTDDPFGYGRIMRDAMGMIVEIREQRDLKSDEERAIKEWNPGIYAANKKLLEEALASLEPNNAQGEYYLTDIIAMAVKDRIKVTPLVAPTEGEVLGVNDKMQLARLEALHRAARARELMLAGATLADPARIDVRGEVTVGRDVFIDANVLFEGRVTLGDRVRVGPNVVLRDMKIGADTVVHPNSVLEQSEVGASCSIGPYARFRPNSRLGDRVHIGNFVELKKTTMGKGAKANHLSYLGDATIGDKSNVGAGTITCNYDGDKKHQTVIGKGVFVGSNSTLVAPVKLADGSYIAAGSAVTADVPAGALAIGRARQENKDGWVETRKRKKSQS